MVSNKVPKRASAYGIRFPAGMKHALEGIAERWGMGKEKKVTLTDVIRTALQQLLDREAGAVPLNTEPKREEPVEP